MVSLVQEGSVLSVTIQLRERDSWGLFDTEILHVQPNLWGANEIDADKRKGSVLVQPLKPGTYVLKDVQFEEGVAQRKWRLTAASKSPIEVREGEVTYLGEIMGTGTLSKPFLGVRAIEYPYLLVSDQRERDMPLAEAKVPALKGKPVTSLAPYLPPDLKRTFYSKRLPDAE